MCIRDRGYAKGACRIRAGWMNFNRYQAELYDRPTASLDLKIRMVKADVAEALLYGCAA